MAANTRPPKKPWLGRDRLATHGALALGTLAGCAVALVADPSAVLAEPLALGLGYIALIYLVAGLLIGPLYLARRRRNPVNIYLRRDVGIWAGITALLHVIFSLQIYAQGQILLYFVQQTAGHYLPLLDLFGLSNDIGLLAAGIILVLLLFSNDQTLRWLKGPRWKRLQQWTYPLIVLTIIHTLGYQFYNEREGGYFAALAVLVLLVAAAQGIGFVVYRRRHHRAEVVLQKHPHPVAPAPVAAGTEGDLTRRAFLVLGGSALLAGISGVVSFRVTRDLLAPHPARPALPGPGSGTSRPPVAARPTPTLPDAGSAPAPPVGGTAPTPTFPDAAPPVAAAPTTPAAPANVLATLDSLPVNSAINFTTPDTGAPAILVHEADGTVHAFSNQCTHRPYPVEYDGTNQQLVCPLHMACFNAANGRVTRGPARRALPAIAVHVDDQGNILYG